MTDFVNLKIKLSQSFEGAHKVKVCIRVFIEVSTHMYISIYVCTVFLKKTDDPPNRTADCSNHDSIILSFRNI
jgi:hypothetical protein